MSLLTYPCSILRSLEGCDLKQIHCLFLSRCFRHKCSIITMILSSVTSDSLCAGSWTRWACSPVQQWSLLSSLALYGQERTRQSSKNSSRRTLLCLCFWWWLWATSSCRSSVELWCSCLESSCLFSVSFLRKLSLLS